MTPEYYNCSVVYQMEAAYMCPPLWILHVQGSHVYLEHNGDLRLLLAEKDQAQGSVHCFSLAEGALFVEAVPQTDISRRITAFQYELVPSQGPGAHMYPFLHPGLGERIHAPIPVGCRDTALFVLNLRIVSSFLLASC